MTKSLNAEIHEPWALPNIINSVFTLSVEDLEMASYLYVTRYQHIERTFFNIHQEIIALPIRLSFTHPRFPKIMSDDCILNLSALLGIVYTTLRRAATFTQPTKRHVPTLAVFSRKLLPLLIKHAHWV